MTWGMSDDADDPRVNRAIRELACALASRGRRLAAISVETDHPAPDADVDTIVGIVSVEHVRSDGQLWALVVEFEHLRRRADK